MKTISIFTVAALAAGFLCGCGSSARRIDPTTQGVTTVRDVNTRDWNDVAARAVNSLVASGALVRQDGRKAIVMINEVKNRSGSRARTQILTNKLRQAMLASGKAVTTTAVFSVDAASAETNVSCGRTARATAYAFLSRS